MARIVYVIIGKTEDNHLCRVGKAPVGSPRMYKNVGFKRSEQSPGWALFFGAARERRFHRFTTKFEANELAARLEEEFEDWAFHVAPIGVRGK